MVKWWEKNILNLPCKGGLRCYVAVQKITHAVKKVKMGMDKPDMLQGK